MKKWILPISVFASFFLIGRYKSYVVSRISNEDSQRVSSIRASEAGSRSKYKVESAAAGPGVVKDPQTKESMRELIQSGEGGKLFQALFDGPFLSQQRMTSDDLAAFRKRFEVPYPQRTVKHERPSEREVRDRVGLIRALDARYRRFPNVDVHEQMVSFLESVLTNDEEHLLVKREALRSFVRVEHRLTEKESSAFLAKLDPLLLSIAALDDRELIGAVLEQTIQ